MTLSQTFDYADSPITGNTETFQYQLTSWYLVTSPTFCRMSVVWYYCTFNNDGCDTKVEMNMDVITAYHATQP